MSLGLSPQEIVDRYKDDRLAIHSDWPRVELREVATVQNGYAFPSAQFNQTSGTPLIRIRNVKRGETDTYFEGAFPAEYLVPAGSVLIGMDGDFNCAIWPGPDALLNQRVCRVQAKDERLDERFLAYVLPAYLEAINEHTSSITVKHLSSRTVQKIPLPLPPLDEQKQIVAAIETQFARLDDAVAALERARTRLKRYRASVLKSACEGTLVPTEADLARQEGRDYEPASALLDRITAERDAAPSKKRGKKTATPVDTSQLPELPEGWAWANFGDLTTRSEYGTSTKCDYDFNGPPVLRIPNMITGQLDLNDMKFATNQESLKNLDPLAANDMLVCRTNGSLNLVGRSSLVPDGIETEYWFASYLLRFKFAGPANLPKWMNAYFWSPLGRRWIESHAASSAGQNNVSLSLFNGMPVPVPPLAEQERIVEEVERRLSVIGQMEATVAANLKRAESLRQSILRQAFSGRLE